jgi:hypothetical protein
MNTYRGYTPTPVRPCPGADLSLVFGPWPDWCWCISRLVYFAVNPVRNRRFGKVFGAQLAGSESRSKSSFLGRVLGPRPRTTQKHKGLFPGSGLRRFTGGSRPQGRLPRRISDGFVQVFSDDLGSQENSFMCHSFMCLSGALSYGKPQSLPAIVSPLPEIQHRLGSLNAHRIMPCGPQG